MEKVNGSGKNPDSFQQLKNNRVVPLLPLQGRELNVIGQYCRG